MSGQPLDHFPHPLLHLVRTTPDGHTLLRPEGELVASTVPAFHQALADLRERENVVIDLSAVEFIDSAGLGALIGEIHRCADRGNELVLICGRASLRHVLQITGIDRIVSVVSTPGDVVTAGAVTPPTGGHEEPPLRRMRLGR